MSDTPKVIETLIELFKIDMETGKSTAQGNASLEGAEFTWNFYAGYYNKNNLPAAPTRTWTTKTVAETGSDGLVHYVTKLADNYKVSGDSFYTQNGIWFGTSEPDDSKGALLYDTYEIEEKVKLINPKITANGYKIGNRGFTNYILSADDMVKA